MGNGALGSKLNGALLMAFQPRYTAVEPVGVVAGTRRVVALLLGILAQLCGRSLVGWQINRSTIGTVIQVCRSNSDRTTPALYPGRGYSYRRCGLS